jgi:4-diphosphocytidyl-2-C-methyl-D-erythritol kinase
VTRTYRSFAKINLHLQVDGRLPDGYHQLRTIFQTVSLHDLVTIEETSAAGVDLQVPDGGAPSGESNLVHRAARAVLERWAPRRGVRIVLRKRIPAGGGLGGGSSNAALTLSALPELLQLVPPAGELRAIARELGADVPYFLVGGTALGLGRGDEVVALPELPEERVLLVAPGVEISTAEVFAALGRPRPRPMPAAIVDYLATGRADGIAGLDGFNDLEEPVLERVAEIRSVYTALRRAGATCVRLSGSGGTVFACFADVERGREAERSLPGRVRTFAVRTLSRSAAMESRVVSAEEGDWL